MNMTATEQLMRAIGPRVVVECPACGDPLFEDRVCPRCLHLEAFYESARKAKAEQERKQLFRKQPGRVDMGVVPHAPAPKAMDTGTFLIVGGVGVALAGAAGFGLWWLMKGAIEWLAEHS